MKRFAIMAFLGTMLCGSLMAEDGNADETSVTNAASGTTTTTTIDKDE